MVALELSAAGRSVNPPQMLKSEMTLCSSELTDVRITVIILFINGWKSGLKGKFCCAAAAALRCCSCVAAALRILMNAAAALCMHPAECSRNTPALLHSENKCLQLFCFTRFKYCFTLQNPQNQNQNPTFRLKSSGHKADD